MQLHRASWEEPPAPTVPRWRQRLADPDGGDQPLRPLQPQRDALVVSLSEAQWAALRDQARASLSRVFQKAAVYLDQIGEKCGSG